MSPVRACNRHGRAKCGICAGREQDRRRRAQRPQRSAAERRAMAEDVLLAHGDLCMLCREPVDVYLEHPDPSSLVLAHVISHADGGLWTVDNLRPAHKLCNEQAGR